jgi:hypothetical protein
MSWIEGERVVVVHLSLAGNHQLAGIVAVEQLW